MKKKIRYVDEDTLEIKEIVIEEEIIEDDKPVKPSTELNEDEIYNLIKQALDCEPELFEEVYNDYKKAQEKFNTIYEPFKERLIKLHEDYPDIAKTIIIGDAKLTYVSPSTRRTIDTKKLKEEEPSIAAKYTKSTDVKATIRMEDCK